jgi:type I restriction enzyme S subunit
MGRPMATSQDFVNWVCSEDLDHNFLKYLFVAEDQDLLRFASGSVHQTIYFPEAKAFHICHPPLPEQRRIVSILDEAFESIVTAQANAARNLQNARALFDSHLQSVLLSKKWKWKSLGDLCDGVEYGSSAKSKKQGKVPVLRMGNIQDGQLDWGNLVYSDDKDEIKKYLLNHNDVLFNRTNSPELVGKTAIYKSEMPAIFAGYLIRIHRKEDLLDAEYLNYFLNSQIAFDYGKTVVISSVNQANINGAKLKSYPIPTPSISEQRIIAKKLNALSAETQRLVAVYERKLAALDALKKSLLHQAFSGELTAQSHQSIVVPFPTKIPNTTTTDLHAGILAAAYALHEKNNLQKHFGHVKAEKIAHMVEAYIGIDLGRAPIKDAAGPNDYPHQLSVEHRARKAGYFDFKRVDGAGYQVKRLRQFDELVRRTRERLGNLSQELDSLLELMLPMNTQQAEIFSTVYAAWNNLLLDGAQPSDEEIVLEAREHWHTAKLKIPREKFFAAINWLREKDFVPTGKGRKVGVKLQR